MSENRTQMYAGVKLKLAFPTENSFVSFFELFSNYLPIYVQPN